MRFFRRLKRTTRQYITVAFICIVVIGTAAIATSVIMIGQIRQEYEYMLNEARREMDENKNSVLVAISDIKTGEIISEDMIEERVVYTSQPEAGFITKDDLGKPAIIDIPEGTHIIKSMVAHKDVSSVLREVEYDVIHIGSHIEANDFVDIRIFYPNGETFVVLAKKQLKGYQPSIPICYLWVDEEELLRMSAAIVDAGLYTGSKLYMTKYIEPNIQEASVITYTPGISVLKLIENDPNIVNRCSQLLNIEVRKALENRLSESLERDVKGIYWDIDGEIRYMPEAGDGQSDGVSDLQNYKEGTSTENKKIVSEDEREIIGDVKEVPENDKDYTEEGKAGTGNKVSITDGSKPVTEDDTENVGSTGADILNNAELGQIYDIDYFMSTGG